MIGQLERRDPTELPFDRARLLNRHALRGKGYAAAADLGSLSEFEKRQAYNAEAAGGAGTRYHFGYLTPPALSGGIIQQARGPVGTSNGTGFTKRYSYDRCAVVNPPPYFPTTGRFQENRYLELDPAGFNHTNYFQSLTPDP